MGMEIEMGCFEDGMLLGIVCFRDLGRIDLENLTWHAMIAQVIGTQWVGEVSVEKNTFFGTFDSFPQFPQLLARNWSKIRQGRNGSRLPNPLPGLQLTKKDEGRLKGVLVVDVFLLLARLAV